MVSIVQQQQSQYKNLQVQLGNLRNVIIEKDQEIAYLTGKVKELINKNVEMQKNIQNNTKE